MSRSTAASTLAGAAALLVFAAAAPGAHAQDREHRGSPGDRPASAAAPTSAPVTAAAAPQTRPAQTAIANTGETGSYLQSCRNSTVSSGRLFSECRSPSGPYRRSSIEIGRCVGDVGNQNGILGCNGAIAQDGGLVAETPAATPDRSGRTDQGRTGADRGGSYAGGSNRNGAAGYDQGGYGDARRGDAQPYGYDPRGSDQRGYDPRSYDAGRTGSNGRAYDDGRGYGGQGYGPPPYGNQNGYGTTNGSQGYGNQGYGDRGYGGQGYGDQQSGGQGYGGRAYEGRYQDQRRQADLVLFDGPNFTGRSFEVRGDIGDLKSKGFNDRARSAKIYSGRWKLCREAQYSRCVHVSADVPDLNALAAGAQISSVERE